MTRRRQGGSSQRDVGHRVAEELRMKLTELLLREVRDPRVVGVTVTRVEMVGDYSGAHVWFRAMPGGPSEAEATAGLRSVAGFLRGELGRSMRLRKAPELRFDVDSLPDQGQRIEDLLAQVTVRAGGADPAGDGDHPDGDDDE